MFPCCFESIFITATRGVDEFWEYGAQQLAILLQQLAIERRCSCPRYSDRRIIDGASFLQLILGWRWLTDSGVKCNYFAHIYLISRQQCLHSGKSLIMNIRDLSNWSDQWRKLQIRNLGTHQKLGKHLKWLEKTKTNLKMYTFSVFRTKRLTKK